MTLGMLASDRALAPIYQPGFAARSILYAADHPHRREYWVGAATMATLAANAIAPGLLDRYLGRTGVKSQRTKHQQEPGAPVNLWEPTDGPDGAAGRSTRRAHPCKASAPRRRRRTGKSAGWQTPRELTASEPRLNA
jgi:hypothetical protein